MSIFVFEPPPRQSPINRNRITAMLGVTPRRSQLALEWPKQLYEPDGPDKIVLPFCETLANAFEVMCDVPGSELRPGRGERCYAFLDDAKENPDTLEKVRKWLALIGVHVAIRDCLALSFALDYDRVGGDPNQPHGSRKTQDPSKTV